MATPPVCDFGWQARPFELPATDGRQLSLEDVQGPNGCLIMFICNHCPYVAGKLDRIIGEAKACQEIGIGVAAISSNDVVNYPQDSFENMCRLTQNKQLPFPYLFDETQDIARIYDAQCTPDFFGFNAKAQLQYRGRLDSAHMGDAPLDMRRDLFEAMKLIAQTGEGPRDQVPSMGCSIKWKAA